MKCSGEIVLELGAVLRSKGNLPIKSIIVCTYKNSFEQKFGCYSKDGVGEFLGDLLNASLSKTILEVSITSWVADSHCGITVWVEDSEDGTTNIDADVVEAFSKLKWKW